METVLLRRSRLNDGLVMARSLLDSSPFLIARDRSEEMAALVRRVVTEERPDLLHVVQLNMAQYVLGIPGIPKILDQENAVSLILERLYQLERPGLRKTVLGLEWRKLARYESQVCQQFDHILAVTEEDKRALLAQIPNPQPVVSEVNLSPIPITVIPIGIDCEAVRPVPRQPGARGILGLGTMFWPPNADGVLWFAREVYPLIKQRIPEVRFYIIGARPPNEVIRLGVRDESIKVPGYVEDITHYIEDSAMIVVPLRAGGGMRVKILDAWARGIPIISTRIGCEGIEVRSGENILVADTPLDFAQAVVQVIRNKELAQRLAENGRRWVEERYDWRAVYRKLDEVYEGLQVSGHRSQNAADES
jgi:glycosyltransferase involved in cell wall biosynthesis